MVPPHNNNLSGLVLKQTLRRLLAAHLCGKTVTEVVLGTALELESAVGLRFVVSVVCDGTTCVSVL